MKQPLMLVSLVVILLLAGFIPVFALEGCCCTQPADQSPLWPLDNQTCAAYTTGVLFENATIEHDCRAFCETVIHESPDDIEAVPNVTIPKNVIKKIPLVEEVEINVTSVVKKPVLQNKKPVVEPEEEPAAEEDEELVEEEVQNAKNAPKKAVTKVPGKPSQSQVEEEPEELFTVEPEVVVLTKELSWWWILLGAVVLGVLAETVRRRRAHTKKTLAVVNAPALKTSSQSISSASTAQKNAFVQQPRPRTLQQPNVSSQTLSRAPMQQRTPVVFARPYQPRVPPITQTVQVKKQVVSTPSFASAQLQTRLSVLTRQRLVSVQQKSVVLAPLQEKTLPQELQRKQDSFAKLRQIAKK